MLFRLKFQRVRLDAHVMSEYMKMNTLQKIYNTLVNEWPAVEVDENVQKDALKPIERMLALS